MDNFFKPQNLILAIKITRLFINPSTKKKKTNFLTETIRKTDACFLILVFQITPVNGENVFSLTERSTLTI